MKIKDFYCGHKHNKKSVDCVYPLHLKVLGKPITRMDANSPRVLTRARNCHALFLSLG